MQPAPLTLPDVTLRNQRVMLREDLNVPMKNGMIANDARIQRALPTIRAVLAQGAAVMVLSHLGRPVEGEYDAQYSLAPVAEALTQSLGQPVTLVKDWLAGVDVVPGQVVLCENVRFNVGEKANDPVLAKRMAALCDVFVMDAFATAHRAQASTTGVTEFAKTACAGPLLMSELTALETAFTHPAAPVVGIVGGSKVSTKIQLLEHLLDKVDTLVVGGGIANTLLAAAGQPIGASLHEPDWVAPAKQLLEKAKATAVAVPLPIDVVVATEFSENASATVKPVAEVLANEMILDVGPATQATYGPMMAAAGTILWNGPVGVFEFPAFSKGTQALGHAIAESTGYSLAGGGDTVAAIDVFAISDRISYVSTGGGAFLAFLEGEALPAVVALLKRATHAS